MVNFNTAVTVLVSMTGLQLALGVALSFSPSTLETNWSLSPGHDPFKAIYRPLPSLREQDALEREWVRKRYDLIPKVLEKYGFDAWILSMREYAEDTVFPALYSTTTTFSARRRTIFLFHTRTDIRQSPLLLIDNTDQIWIDLNETLQVVKPNRIAVNIDRGIAFSDGLHSGEGQSLFTHLDPYYLNRTQPFREIPIEVVATRVGGQEQLKMYRLLMENVWAMISEGLSEKVVVVGKTTVEDLEWWFRDVIRWRIGCTTWFHPSVDIIRNPSLPDPSVDPYIRPGDVLHVDIGITAMGMNTDTQHLAYVVPCSSSPLSSTNSIAYLNSVPAGLLRGLHNVNRLQNIVKEEMIPGRTGDQVFIAVKKKMEHEKIDGDIYSHPIGDRGHSAGAIIGMTNIQGDLGSNKVLENYWTSVELAGRTFVPEWNTTIRFELEEDVYWDPESRKFEWVWGQQTKFHLVRPTQCPFHLVSKSLPSKSWKYLSSLLNVLLKVLRV